MNDFIDPYEPEEVTLTKKAELSLVWLLPLCALLVSSWLIYKSVSEKGPVITISFPTAEGLEVDKTKIKYLDVDIGKVTAISIGNDSKSILVSAQMNSDASGYLKQTTRFWVVKPQVGLGGVSGLGTLLSGAYIAIKPGEGKKERNFNGLTNPPLIKTNAEGRQFILETADLGSMRPGTPINFHGISVGEVLSHKLSEKADKILLSIFINAPYDKFIRKNTRFWIDSGVDLSASADGFKVRTGPLISLLSGGIAFRADEHDDIVSIQPENSSYKLYENYEKSTQVVYTNILKYIMFFDGSLRGLTEGAPVELRGIPIGKVTNISLQVDEKTADIHIPVVVELEPDRIKEINHLTNISDQDIMEQLIKKGLRAQLKNGSLLTGQLLIELDFYPKNKVAVNSHTHTHTSDYPEFPTVASSLDEFAHSAQIIMDKVAKLPLEDLTLEINKTMQTVQGTSKAATDMLVTAKGTLSSTDKTIKSANQVLSTLEPGSSNQYELNKLLHEFSQAANSVKQLVEYLEQNPDALLRGKKEEQKSE